MTFPNFSRKHTEVSTPLVTPERFVRHVRERGLLEGFVAPAGVILLYQRPYARGLLQREPHRASPPFPEWLHVLDRTEGKVGILAFFGIGAPAMSTVVETLGALGTRRFVNLGAAGGLRARAIAWATWWCATPPSATRGCRTTTCHRSCLAHPSETLTRALADRLASQGHTYKRGATWTIDAPFRETTEELRHYREDGVLTVEMEAAALFAVAQHRQFDAAAAFVLSDTLSDAEWIPDFGAPEIVVGLDILVQAAIDVIVDLA